MDYRSSVAYDLSRYETKQVEKTPELKVIENKALDKKAKRLSSMKIIFLMIVAATVISFLLYNRAVLTEIGAEIDSYSKQLNILQSEHARLQTELDAKTSMRNVEEYAKRNLNLIKADNSQIVYMDMGQGDKVEIMEEGTDLSFFDKIAMSVSPILEYLHLK